MNKFQFELLDIEKINRATDEVIDLLRKKHGLSPLECAYTLEMLLRSLEDTMGAKFSSELKVLKK